MILASQFVYPRPALQRIFRGTDEESKNRFESWFEIADAVFFASLFSEEHALVRVSVVWMPGGAAALAAITDSEPASESHDPPLAWDVVPFEPQRDFDPHQLRKLSRGLRYGRQVIVVGGTAPHLRIEGIATLREGTDGGRETLRVHAVGPGRLIFEGQTGEMLSIDRGIVSIPGKGILDTPLIEQRLFRMSMHPSGTEGFLRGNPFPLALPDLIRRIRRTGHGGILAILDQVPGSAELQQNFYRLSDPAFLTRRILEHHDAANRAFGHLFRPEEREGLDADEKASSKANAELQRAIDLVGQLSAIDGAVLAGPLLAIYGAGYLIAGGAVVEPLGAPRRGARHQAALRFAASHPEGLAFVVSEDGPVSCALVDDGQPRFVDVWVPELEVNR